MNERVAGDALRMFALFLNLYGYAQQPRGAVAEIVVFNRRAKTKISESVRVKNGLHIMVQLIKEPVLVFYRFVFGWVKLFFDGYTLLCSFFEMAVCAVMDSADHCSA